MVWSLLTDRVTKIITKIVYFSNVFRLNLMLANTIFD